MKRATIISFAILGITLGVIAGLLIPQLSNTTPVALPQTVRTSTTPSATLACTVKDIKIGLNPSNSGAGHNYYNLVFVNTSGDICTLDGYPGISLVDASGNQLGDPAVRATATSSVITLQAGGIAHAVIDFPVAANFTAGQCSAAAASLKAFLPGETAPLSVVSTQQACPGWSVQPILGGPGQ